MGPKVAAGNTRSTRHDRGQAVAPSSICPLSVSIEADPLMRPATRTVSRKRCASEREEDYTTPQPRRKSARLYQLQPPIPRQPHQARVDKKLLSDISKLNDSPEKNTTQGSVYSKRRQRNIGAKPVPLSGGNRVCQTRNTNHHETRATAIVSAEITKQQVTKRQRSDEDKFDPEPCAKRAKYDLTPHIESNAATNKKNFVTDWLTSSSWSRKSLDAAHILEAQKEMSRRHQTALPSPQSSFAGTEATSKKSERSSASVHDADYYDALQKRNIFVEREDPPAELMRRARRLIMRPRASPEMDDIEVQTIKEKSRRHRNDAEDVIVKLMAPSLIPAMTEVPDRRLEMNANQPWSNSVPVPLDASVLNPPLPLPKPVPDVAFGYSEGAFTRNQLGTIDLLIDKQSGRSYAMPDKKLRFPFLSVEFKSQAKSGTHYVGTNQAAGTGAIAMNGSFELILRSFGPDAYDYNEPQFFSVIIDHELARINVHWLKAAPAGGQHSAHVAGVSKYLLDDNTGIRRLVRGIKNILGDGGDARLRILCEALDAYRDKIVRNRETANPENRQRLGPASVNQDSETSRMPAIGTRKIRPRLQQQALSPHLPTDQQSELNARATATAFSQRRNRHQQLADTRTLTDLGLEAVTPENRTSLRTEQINSDTQSRQTRSSSKTQPVEVEATRGKSKSQAGWTFERQGRRLFVPDDKWRKSTKGGRAAFFNSEHNVWCYAE